LEGFFICDLEARGIEDDMGFCGEPGIEGGVIIECRGIEVAGKNAVGREVSGVMNSSIALRLREAAMT